MNLWKRLVMLWHGAEEKPKAVSSAFGEGLQRFAGRQVAEAKAAQARALAAKANSPDGQNPYTFEIDWEEHQKVKAFMKEHEHRGQYMGAIGGHISFTFCPTSIGTVASVHCSACGEQCCKKGYRKGASTDCSGML
jgi:hypothetical protein